MEVNLLEKTELRIDGIITDGTNLTELAATVAALLELPDAKVMVIDVRPDQVAFDILMRTVRAETFFGKERALLDAVAKVSGVTLLAGARIHSAGILGAIALDEAEAAEALTRSEAMGEAIHRAIRAKVRIFPTGFELIEGRIIDTNTPYLVKLFGEAGYLPEAGMALADNLPRLVSALGTSSEECGLVITTGGVGAEDKDFSVEAILDLDPTAATPYLVRFAKGEGRHVKDGIRIGVGERNGCLLVALPGPHDEVRRAAPILIQGFKQGWDKTVLATKLADAIRAKFLHQEETRHGHHHGPHIVETSQ